MYNAELSESQVRLSLPLLSLIFCKVESNESRQLELLTEFYGKVQERNINRARSNKPPADYEMVWAILRYTVQKSSGNPDKLMSGACYSAANDDLLSRHKKSREVNEKTARELADAKVENKRLQEELRIAKKNAKSHPKVKAEPSSTGQAKPAHSSSTKSKVEGCCGKYNRGEACDKSCGKAHKCSWVDRSVVPPRVCWATDHEKINHPQ